MSKELDPEKLNELTAVMATQLVEEYQYCEELRLPCLTTLSDAAAKILSKYMGYLDLSGLTTLSDAAAKHLSKCKGSLSLSGLTALSDDAAKSLRKNFWIIIPELIPLQGEPDEANSKQKRATRATPLEPGAALEKLLAMPLDKRIELVAQDIRTKQKRLREISVEDLAEALEVPLDNLSGGNNDEWSWEQYTPIKDEDLQDYVESYDDLWEMIEKNRDKFDERRFAILKKKSEKLDSMKLLKLLSESEAELLFRLYELEYLDSRIECGDAMLLGSYSALSDRGFDVTFEAEVDQGGYARISGPYDEQEEPKNTLGKSLNADNCYFESDSSGKRTYFEDDESEDEES